MAYDPRSFEPPDSSVLSKNTMDMDEAKNPEYSPTATASQFDEDFDNNSFFREDDALQTPMNEVPTSQLHAALYDAISRDDQRSVDAIFAVLNERDATATDGPLVADPPLEAYEALDDWRSNCLRKGFYAQTTQRASYAIDATHLWGIQDWNELRHQHQLSWQKYNPLILDSAYMNGIDYAVVQRRAESCYIKAIPCSAEADHNLTASFVLGRGNPHEVAELEARFGMLHPHDSWWVCCWAMEESGGFGRHKADNGELHVSLPRIQLSQAAGCDLNRQVTFFVEYLKMSDRNRYGTPSLHFFKSERGRDGHLKFGVGCRPLGGGVSIVGGLMDTPWLGIKMETSAVPKMTGYELLFFMMGSTIAPEHSNAIPRLHTALRLG